MCCSHAWVLTNTNKTIPRYCGALKNRIYLHMQNIDYALPKETMSTQLGTQSYPRRRLRLRWGGLGVGHALQHRFVANCLGEKRLAVLSAVADGLDDSDNCNQCNHREERSTDGERGEHSLAGCSIRELCVVVALVRRRSREWRLWGWRRRRSGVVVALLLLCCALG